MTTADTRRVLNGLWVGNTLDYLEQLCLVSGLACGHSVRLFSYEPKTIRGVPSGIEIHDAADVMPRERMISYRDCGSYALGSNFWRYEMLGRGLGYWLDLDVLVLKPLADNADYVFGQEQEGGINTAVMFAPADSAFVRDLRSLPRANRCPPWYGPRNRVRYFAKRMRGHVGLEDFPWGTFGPRMLTYVARKHDVLRFAADPQVFYPVSWREIRNLYGPSDRVEHLVTERTLAVHLYNSQLRELTKCPPPRGSYIRKQCERLGIA